MALMLVAVLHFVPDEAGPRRIVDTLLGALPSGSYLVASHATCEYYPDRGVAAASTYNERGIPFSSGSPTSSPRSRSAAWTWSSRGGVSVSDWRPEDGGPPPLPDEVSWDGGVAGKP